MNTEQPQTIEQLVEEGNALTLLLQKNKDAIRKLRLKTAESETGISVGDTVMWNTEKGFIKEGIISKIDTSWNTTYYHAFPQKLKGGLYQKDVWIEKADTIKVLKKAK